jgi:hypothetical protein
MGVLEKIIEQFPACRPSTRCWRQLAASLFSEDLIPELFRLLDVRGFRRADLLLAVNEIGRIPDAPALENCALSQVAFPMPPV